MQLILICGCYFVDVDECTDNTHLCASQANCSNIMGNYTCLCNAGYTGNGFTCSGKLLLLLLLLLVVVLLL